MSYIWEDYACDKKFIVGRKVCPYMEVYENNSVCAEINPMIRFPEIIDLDALKYDNSGEVQNIVFHYLAQLDKVKGLSYFQSIIESVREEIDKGYWGKNTSNLWRKLSLDNQEIIISVLVQRLLNDNKTYFMDVIGKLFPEASLCYEKKTNQYYLYIRAEENTYNSDLIAIAKILFLNIKNKVLTVWENHYGIIGTDDTMHIGRIQVV